jgi:DNA polymerase
MDGLKIAIVGEAYGQEEAVAGKPFVGAAGQELNRMLKDAGIKREDCYLTNVFNENPPRNNIEYFLGPKVTASKKVSAPLIPSKFLQPKFEHHIDRLYAELETVRPNLCICLGNTACWALLETTKISKIRGTVALSPVLPWLKCLATYHPAAVLRQYDLRHVTVLDLVKARKEAEFPEIRRPVREIWLDPTIEDIKRFYSDHVLPAEYLACDIETNYGNQITCIGFAPSKFLSMCIPIYDMSKPTGSYWNTLEEELEVWDLIQLILNSPAQKIYQNGMYDCQHLWQNYGLVNTNAGEDTMLLHHSLHPEAPKALDFLGSVYCSESAWKTLKSKGKEFSLKRND